MKDYQKIVRYFLIGGGIAIFIYVVMRLVIMFLDKPPELPIVWKDTIGVFDPKGHTNGKIMYYVGSNMYIGTFYHRNNGAVLGEKYTMRYNINDPNMIEVDYWNPVFESNEKTYEFAARIKKLHRKSIFKPIPHVVFEFNIKHLHFERYRYLPQNYEQLFPDIKEGNYYIVECLADYPNRMVLHLDKPIKK